jgi:hypothetical protein
LARTGIWRPSERAVALDEAEDVGFHDQVVLALEAHLAAPHLPKRIRSPALTPGSISSPESFAGALADGHGLALA